MIVDTIIIVFLPRSKCLLILWLQSPSTVILEPKIIKYVTVSTFSPSICHEVMRPDIIILVFWMLSFKPTFSLSPFTLIKRLFSSYSLSAIRVVSSAYLRLLIFLPAILIPACDSFSRAFRMMYSVYRLNRGQYTALTYSLPNFEPVCCSMSGSDCCFLTWIRVFQETRKMIWYSHLFKTSSEISDRQISKDSPLLWDDLQMWVLCMSQSSSLSHSGLSGH